MSLKKQPERNLMLSAVLDIMLKAHLPGAGEGAPSKPYPFTVGDSCGISSFPSGPTLPCLNCAQNRVNSIILYS